MLLCCPECRCVSQLYTLLISTISGSAHGVISYYAKCWYAMLGTFSSEYRRLTQWPAALMQGWLCSRPVLRTDFHHLSMVREHHPEGKIHSGTNQKRFSFAHLTQYFALILIYAGLHFSSISQAFSSLSFFFFTCICRLKAKKSSLAKVKLRELLKYWVAPVVINGQTVAYTVHFTATWQLHSHPFPLLQSLTHPSALSAATGSHSCWTTQSLQDASLILWKFFNCSFAVDALKFVDRDGTSTGRHFRFSWTISPC